MYSLFSTKLIVVMCRGAAGGTAMTCQEMIFVLHFNGMVTAPLTYTFVHRFSEHALHLEPTQHAHCFFLSIFKTA